MKIFQILHGRCHWQTPFQSLAETVGRFPADCLFVEAPDYVNEQWGFDDTEIGDARFIKPVPPEGFIYDDETGQMYPIEMLDTLLKEAQNNKQNENNVILANFLKANPMTWVDGKLYGVTMEDQNEIAMNILSYEMAIQANAAIIEQNPEAQVTEPILEWHATHEACTPWTYENLVALSLAIRRYVYPWYQLNQSYKTQIFACESVSAVNAINLVYEMPSDEEESVETETADPSTGDATESATEPTDDVTTNTTEDSSVTEDQSSNDTGTSTVTE